MKKATSLNRDISKNKRRSSSEINTMIYSKVPPQAKDLEEAVLGAIMLEKGAFDTVIEILKPECFYVDAHYRIFHAMQAMALRNQPIDMLTVVEELRFKEELDLVGGPYYVTKLTNSVVSSANIEAHCRIIYERFLKREQIGIYSEALSNAYEDSTDPFDLLAAVEAKVTDLATSGESSQGKDMATVLVDRMRYQEEKSNRKDDEVLGVTTGFPIIDKATKGWMPTHLIVFAARPSVGKTALALNVARNAAADPNKPTPVAFFSLEMDEGNLTDRLLSSESGIAYDAITDCRLTFDQKKSLFEKGVCPLSNYPITLEYCPSLNILELRAKTKRWAKTWRSKRNSKGELVYENGLVIIDYLQLMSGLTDEYNHQTRDQVLSTITRSLKKLAGELNVPIIALSQLSREIEKRRDGKPQLSDLRESGAIEQDADVVAFLMREDYEQAEFEVDQEKKGKAFVWFKKNRNGKLDRIPMRTELEIQRWMTTDQYDMYYRNKQGLQSAMHNGKHTANLNNEEFF
jgi:replicative DNA helicase